jgi:hypothetical protein
MFLRNIFWSFKSAFYPKVTSFPIAAKIMANKINTAFEEPVLRVTRSSKRKFNSSLTNEDAETPINVSKHSQKSLHSPSVTKAEITGKSDEFLLEF